MAAPSHCLDAFGRWIPNPDYDPEAAAAPSPRVGIVVEEPGKGLRLQPEVDVEMAWHTAPRLEAAPPAVARVIPGEHGLALIVAGDG